MTVVPIISTELSGAPTAQRAAFSAPPRAQCRSHETARIDACLALCDDMDAAWFALLARLDLTVAYPSLSRLRQALADVRIVISAPSNARAASAITGEWSTTANEVTENNAAPDYLCRAERYINDHLREKISVSDVARYAGVSVRSLQFAFAQHRAQTPHRFIISARLAAAHHCLVGTESNAMSVANEAACAQTLSELAQQWGFASASRFSSAYRRRYGHTPSKLLNERKEMQI